MQGEEMRAERVRIIALSRTRQLIEAAARTPAAYKRETVEYARAMYEILDALPSERLASQVAALAESYGAFGMAEDAYIADSLMNKSHWKLLCKYLLRACPLIISLVSVTN